MQRENKGSGKAAPTLEKMGQEGEFVLANIKTYKTVTLVFLKIWYCYRKRKIDKRNNIE